jgi:hypothetical protein
MENPTSANLVKGTRYKIEDKEDGDSYDFGERYYGIFNHYDDTDGKENYPMFLMVKDEVGKFVAPIKKFSADSIRVTPMAPEYGGRRRKTKKSKRRARKTRRRNK